MIVMEGCSRQPLDCFRRSNSCTGSPFPGVSNPPKRGRTSMLHKSHFAVVLSAYLLFSVAPGIAQNQGATNFSASNATQVVNIQQNGSGYALKPFTNSTWPVGAFFGQASGTTAFNNAV